MFYKGGPKPTLINHKDHWTGRVVFRSLVFLGPQNYASFVCSFFFRILREDKSEDFVPLIT